MNIVIVSIAQAASGGDSPKGFERVCRSPLSGLLAEPAGAPEAKAQVSKGSGRSVRFPRSYSAEQISESMQRHRERIERALSTSK